MEYKLYDSERKVMEVLWDGGDMSAKELSQRLQAQVGWSKSTTYTILKKCIAIFQVLQCAFLIFHVF